MAETHRIPQRVENKSGLHRKSMLKDDFPPFITEV
jgi:hypothetical protein